MNQEPPPLKVISAAEFATSFALRPQMLAWFLGAGASAAAGIPTGYAMICDFKRQIYCRETGFSIREVDATDPLWRNRIEAFFRTSSILPPSGDPTEYAAAFEAIYPSERQRRQYIDDKVSKGTPSFAHRALAALVSTGQCNCIFTTNFDQLVETSVTLTDQMLDADKRALPTVAAIDSSERARRCVEESDWPLIAKLHGDYQSTKIKNTGQELEKQDENMRAVLVEACHRFGLVVVGYSGRDASVMESLEAAIDKASSYPGGLFWVTSSSTNLLPSVQALLRRAAANGVEATIVESPTFDELAGALIRQIALPDHLLKHVLERSIPAQLEQVRLPTQESGAFPVLRISALLIEQVPRVARRVSLAKQEPVENIRKILKENRCRAVVATIGSELAVFGNDEAIVAALSPLGARLAGTIELDPCHESWAMGLLYDALTSALSRGRPLIPRYKRAGHALVVAASRPDDEADRVQDRQRKLAPLVSAYEGPLTGVVPNLGYRFQEGIHVRLENIDGKWWCSFDPFTSVDVPYQSDHALGESRSEEETTTSYRGDPAGDWRRERWAKKYNKQWAGIIGAWASLLSSCKDGRISSIGLSNDEGIDAEFYLSKITAWSRPSHRHAYFQRTK